MIKGDAPGDGAWVLGLLCWAVKSKIIEFLAQSLCTVDLPSGRDSWVHSNLRPLELFSGSQGIPGSTSEAEHALSPLNSQSIPVLVISTKSSLHLSPGIANSRGEFILIIQIHSI